jgi:hypothetical protein
LVSGAETLVELCPTVLMAHAASRSRHENLLRSQPDSSFPYTCTATALASELCMCVNGKIRILIVGDWTFGLCSYSFGLLFLRAFQYCSAWFHLGGVVAPNTNNIASHFAICKIVTFAHMHIAIRNACRILFTNYLVDVFWSTYCRAVEL